MLLKKIINKIKNKTKKINANDNLLIKKTKKNFNHKKRIFFYKNKKYTVDCLTCQACPGILETYITELSKKIIPTQNKILNLGSGNGEISSILENIGFDVYNLDINIKKENLKNKKFNLNDQNSLPYQKKFFDYVLCSEVIEHIENPWKLFRDIKKVLKKNGILILTTPNIHSKKSKKIFQKNNYFHWFEKENLEYHINPLPFWEIKLISEKNNFKIFKILGSGDYYFNQQKKFKKLLRNNEALIFIIKNDKHNNSNLESS
jgi:2-polyprenyl-3-methyl-5-hydroxy-6-metoxy-1,4-benzoquinol methylase